LLPNVAGTSAGAINAASFAIGNTVEDTQSMLVNDAATIFKYQNLPPPTFWPIYSNKGLVETLTTALGSRTFGDLQKKLCINTYCVTPFSGTTWNAVTINNLDGNFTHAKLVDSVAASASAPIYFPIYNTSNIFVDQPQASFVDGGVFANNPTVNAIQTAYKSGIPLEDIAVLSIGTGYVNEMLKDVGDGCWGVTQWLNLQNGGKPLYLADLLLGTQLYDIQDSANLILGDNYMRVNFQLPNAISLDDYQAIPTLLGIGNDFDVKPIWDWLEKLLPQNEQKEEEIKVENKKQNKKQNKKTNKKGCTIN